MSEEIPTPTPAASTEGETGAEPTSGRRPAAWQQALPWAITILCFGYLYTRLSGAAAREGMDLFSYLGGIFGRVSWIAWLGWMVPYSFFFFLIDSAVVWRVVNWFNTPVRYTDILPIRGSSYILSILNEQVGKGAMGLYLYRRYGVPGWEVGSSMIFIMFCEFFYLLTWATIGWVLVRSDLPEVFGLILVAGAAFLFGGDAPPAAEPLGGATEAAASGLTLGALGVLGLAAVGVGVWTDRPQRCHDADARAPSSDSPGRARAASRAGPGRRSSGPGCAVGRGLGEDGLPGGDAGPGDVAGRGPGRGLDQAGGDPVGPPGPSAGRPAGEARAPRHPPHPQGRRRLPGLAVRRVPPDGQDGRVGRPHPT